MTLFGSLPPAKRRRLVARALLRAFGSAAILVVLYYVLPLDHLSSTISIALLVVGLVAVAVVIGWEARAIVNAEYPGAQAIEALAMTVPLFLLLFSTGYFLMEHAAPTSFTEPLSRTDALYFTVTTFATVGYGDITAKTETARVVVIFQMITDLAVLGFGVKVLFGAAQMGRQRRAEAESEGGSSFPGPSVSPGPAGAAEADPGGP